MLENKDQPTPYSKTQEVVDTLDAWLLQGGDSQDGHATEQDVNTEDQLERYLNHSYRVQCMFEFDGKQNNFGIIAFPDTFMLTFPYSGYTTTTREVHSDTGGQTITMNREQYKEFLNFVFKNQAFHFVIPKDQYTSVEVCGVIEKKGSTAEETAETEKMDELDTTDFLPKPRLQIEFVKLDFDDTTNELVEFKRNKMFLEISEQLRTSIRQTINAELQGEPPKTAV